MDCGTAPHVVAEVMLVVCRSLRSVRCLAISRIIRKSSTDSNILLPNIPHNGLPTERQSTFTADALSVNKQLKLDIESIFTDEKAAKGKFDRFITERLKDCKVANIANLFRIAGKKSRNQSHLMLKDRLPEIGARIKSLSASHWNFMHISFVIYGLQSIKGDSNGVSSIISSMTTVAETSLKQSLIMTGQNISMVFLGLQSNSCDDKESKELLRVVTSMVNNCTETLTIQALSNAMYGLQSMSSENAEVRALMLALIPKFEKCDETFTCQHVGNALYGMQGMNSEKAEVRALLSALVPKIEGCTEALSSQAVGNALYGMRGMKSDNAEVCAILTALTPKIASFFPAY